MIKPKTPTSISCGTARVTYPSRPIRRRGRRLPGPGGFAAGMRGRKGSPYEGGHRVPFFLFYPAGDLPAGKDVRELTSYVDFMPTIMALCGVEIPDGRSFHGENLEPVIRAQSAAPWAERTVVCDTQRIAHPMKWQLSSTMKGEWRLLNGTELYDLTVDPGQRDDVSKDFPDRVKSMRQGYEEWWQLVSPQFEADIPIALGADHQTVKLITHDIRNEMGDCAWNQGQVRTGHVVSGYWEVDVRQSETYEIELRRWPTDAGHAVASGIVGDDVDIPEPDSLWEDKRHRSEGSRLYVSK